MDGYPPEYISHNIPLIVLSGLGSIRSGPRHGSATTYPLLQEKGPHILSDLPDVSGGAADELLACFQELDAKDAAWNNRPGKGKLGTMAFRIQSVGRDYILPPRKANPPSVSPFLSDDSQTSGRRFSIIPTLHSPLSPLTPGFSTFPDGIMTPLWIMKHQELLPSTFISFFHFSVDPHASTLEDNKIKNDINTIKTSITSSSYKIRLIVVLVSLESTSENYIEDRISTIRRATGLDAKNSLFFVPSDLSIVEMRAFVGTILSSIQPQCIEYYRDLSKHTRRKRNRGSVPPPTAPPTSGTSQTLTTPGWNVRYEFKLGVFAEFRQEMDVAGRSYEAAYESLLGDEVFESIASWSPRFNEARLLADTLAIRILRCLLWTSQTTSTVQSWLNHKSRMQDLVDRKGKGSGSYGWKAWEARWSSLMAEMIEKIDVPIFHIQERPDAQSVKLPVIYAIPEKAIPVGERLIPWEMLHHPGYWFHRAATKTAARRELALAIPEEDRRIPDESQISQVVNSKSRLYDTYLCSEPHVEYAITEPDSFDNAELLVKTCRRSIDHFVRRQQARAVEALELDVAQEYMRKGLWKDALHILKPLWQKSNWRRAGWWNILAEVCWAVRQCSRCTGDNETLLAVEWELLSDSLSPRSNWHYDFSNCLDGLDMIKNKPYAIIEAEHTASTLTASFAFGTAEGHVGANIPSQLTVTSRAQKSSTPITVSEISLMFEGGLRSFKISHDPNENSISTTPTGEVQFHDLALREYLNTEAASASDSPSFETAPLQFASSNLTFVPGVSKVFSFVSVPRDPGEITAARANLDLQEKLFQITLVIPLSNHNCWGDWWVRRNDGLQSKKLGTDRSYAIEVLPKPPKLRIELPTIRKTYYTNERVELLIKIINEEEAEADINLDIQLSGPSTEVSNFGWGPSFGQASDEETRDRGTNADAEASHISDYRLGILAPSESWQQSISFQAITKTTEYVLEVKALYRLSSDPDTTVSKTTLANLVFIDPFEVNYDFSARIQPDLWPSYFYVDENEDDDSSPTSPTNRAANGLKQRWSLTARVTSFAVESLVIEDMSLRILEIKNGALCNISRREVSSDQKLVASNDTLESDFILDLQKLSLEDRRSSGLLLQLDIQWHRKSVDSCLATTSLAVHPLVVPFGEPRVLASSTPSDAINRLIHLNYSLENPSIHVLTFSLVMEASEEFAFSGPKTTTIQLLPLSRHTVRYNIMPSVSGKWIQVVFRVVDIYFSKTLKVRGTEGMRTGGKGVLIWVDSED